MINSREQQKIIIPSRICQFSYNLSPKGPLLSFYSLLTDPHLIVGSKSFRYRMFLVFQRKLHNPIFLSLKSSQTWRKLSPTTKIKQNKLDLPALPLYLNPTSRLVHLQKLIKAKMQEKKGEPRQEKESFLFLQNIKDGKIKYLPREKFISKRSYSWTPQQSFLYLTYLRTFSKQFDIPIMAKFLKFFTRMAKLIKTRTSHQIKSHHQKMMLKHHSFELVLEYVELVVSFAMLDSEKTYEKIKKLDEQTKKFLIKERQEVDQLFRFYRVRIEREGFLTRELQEKLIGVLPDLPRSLNVKIQQTEDVYRYFDAPNCLDSAQSKTMCKCESYE